MSIQHFNTSQFMVSLADDRELAIDLLDAFMEDYPERIDALRDALTLGKMENVAKLAHSLKGMCGVVRADILTQLALSLEHAANKGDKNKSQDYFEKILEQMDQSFAEMRVFKDA